MSSFGFLTGAAEGFSDVAKWFKGFGAIRWLIFEVEAPVNFGRNILIVTDDFNILF